MTQSSSKPATDRDPAEGQTTGRCRRKKGPRYGFRSVSPNWRARILPALCLIGGVPAILAPPASALPDPGDAAAIATLSNRKTQVAVPGPSSTWVNTASGTLFCTVPLLSIRGGAEPLGLFLSYNSAWSSLSTRYGRGWQLNYNIFYTRGSDGSGPIAWDNGRVDTFPSLAGTLVSPGDVHEHLREYSPGKLILTTKDGIEFYFDSPIHKKLTSVRDPSGNRLTFTYNAALLLTTIEDPYQRKLQLTYTSDRLSTVADFMGRSYSLKYSTADDLAEVTDPLGNRTTLGYADHTLARITGSYGAPTFIMYSNGVVAGLARGPSGLSFSYDPVQRSTTVKADAPELASATTFIYDALGRISKINRIVIRRGASFPEPSSGMTPTTPLY